MTAILETDVAVVGGGPAGLLAACLLANAGVSCALIAPEPPADTRTTALMEGALRVLAQIGVWPDIAPRAGALKKLRIVDDSGSLIRAPEVVFDCAELGLSAFGHNIPNVQLLAALEAQIAGLGESLFRSPAQEIISGESSCLIRLKDGKEISARLVIGADGRNSICRQAAGITATTHDYPQSALTLNFSHTRPHENISTEFHRRSGPLVVVPLPGGRSSTVLVEHPKEVERLNALSADDLGRELERLTHGLMGRISPEGARGAFQIRGLSVDRFAAKRIALVGESAHVLPPIGAQGLNLGVRDAASIVERAIETLKMGGDPGAPLVLTSYDRDRRVDARPRQIAVDLLNRSLLADFLPMDIARSFGLWALSAVPPLRRQIMRGGLALPLIKSPSAPRL